MNKILIEIIPVIFIFFIGFLLRKTKVLKKENGDLLLKLIFYLSLPALIIFSITSIELSKELLFIPFIAMWVILTTFFISLLIGKLFFAKSRPLGTFLVGSMAMEVSFAIPFVFSAVFIRMFVGLLTGFILINIFNLNGLSRAVVLIASASPICYNTLTFSSLEDLDKEFAADLISLSILVGFLLIPFLLFILN